MRRSLSILVVVVVAAGCGRGSFVGNRLDNFTAYYNTFYNAEKSFEEGAKAIRDATKNQPVDQEVYLPLFGSEARPVQPQPFDDAIKKSADVLREHPDSKWIDDALLLIGKSYFYLQNYVGAELKFKEVMSLDTRLDDEARFWLARTLIASGQYEDAAAHLQESLIREDRSKRWEPKLRLALGELYVKRGDWDRAAQELEGGLEDVRDSELAAHARFLLGQIYETLQRYDEAVAAYDRVSDYNPFYELSYVAQANAVRVEGLHGDPDAALRKLRRMERDDKHYANRAELAYLRGRIYQTMGRHEDALDAYYRLLYDSDANIANVRGKTHYAIGEFYRDVYHDYSLSAAYFDTAATALPGAGGPGNARTGSPGSAPGGQPMYAPAAITDSQEQARVFRSFAEVMEEISRMDSLLYLGSLDEAAFQDVVLEMRQRRAEEMAAQRAEMERREAEQLFSADNFNQRGGESRGTNPDAATAAQTGSAGFLFHQDPVRIQEGLSDFEQRWGRRPLVPNWRRIEAVSGVGSAAAGAGDQETLTVASDQAGVGLPEIDVSGVPRDSVRQAQMRAERAVARYELGNVLFLSMARPDSAAVWYRKVIEEDGDEPVAQRAFYALAEVQRALGDSLAASRLYRAILDQYPHSEFAGRARERLGLPPNQAVAADTLALAEADYARAYDAWQHDAFGASLDEMVEVAARYRRTPVAPRALFAAGSIYMAWVLRDSLSLFDPLPLTVPDSLLRAAGLLKPPPEAPVQQGDPIEQPAETPQARLRGTSNLVRTPDPDTSALAARSRIAVPDDTLAGEPDERRAGRGVLAREPDERRAGRGVLAREPDSLAHVPEARPPGASAGMPDSLDLRPDSLAGMPDSLDLRPDSLDGDVMPADTTATAEPKPAPVYLETLYTVLMERYPQAPQTPQARRVLKALDERRKALEASPDTAAAVLATTPPDTAAAEVDARPDTAAGRPRLRNPGAEQETERLIEPVEPPQAAAADSAGIAADSAGIAADGLKNTPVDTPEALEEQQELLQERLQQPADSAGIAADSVGGADEEDDPGVPEQPPPADTLHAPVDGGPAAPVVEPPVAQEQPPAGLSEEDRARGGWTLVVGSYTDAQRADLIVKNFRYALADTGHPVDVFATTLDGSVHYRVGVGLFVTKDEASAVLARLAPRLPNDAWMLEIAPAD